MDIKACMFIYLLSIMLTSCCSQIVLQGYLVDKSTGLPLRNICVQFEGRPSSCTYSDSNGYFNLKSIHSHLRNYRISIDHRNYLIQSHSPKSPDQIWSSPEHSGSIPQYNDHSIEGTWALTNYFDTIEKYQELAKYRLQKASWFGILLKISNDTLYYYGSIENGSIRIDKSKDTLGKIPSRISGQDWTIVQNGDLLSLLSNDENEVKYSYRKRDELAYFTEENQDFFIIGKNVTDYFNATLIAGTYQNITEDSEIIFYADGRLSGLGFTEFKVRNYFGTLHLHHNLDVMTFSNSFDRKEKQFHWRFSGDTLILDEFIPETTVYKGDTVITDYFVPCRKPLKLIKR